MAARAAYARWRSLSATTNVRALAFDHFFNGIWRDTNSACCGILLHLNMFSHIASRCTCCTALSGTAPAFRLPSLWWLVRQQRQRLHWLGTAACAYRWTYFAAMPERHRLRIRARFYLPRSRTARAYLMRARPACTRSTTFL